MNQERIRCYRKGYGYIAKRQTKSLYYTYTENPDEAKTYKTRQGAARAHGFRKATSELAKVELMFEEICAKDSSASKDNSQ